MNLSFTDKQIKALDLKIKLVPDVVKLVDKIRIGQSHPLYEECLKICHLSKNLYNFALFKVKSQYKENKTILNYETLLISEKLHDLKVNILVKSGCKFPCFSYKNITIMWQLHKS